MSVVVFLALSVVFIGALYYFMFLAKPKEGGGKQEGGLGNGEEPQVVRGGAGRRDAANKLRNRRAQQQGKDSDSGEEIEMEEQKDRLDYLAENNNEEEDKDGGNVLDRAARLNMTKKEVARHEKF